jgi:hypothetical protein
MNSKILAFILFIAFAAAFELTQTSKVNSWKYFCVYLEIINWGFGKEHFPMGSSLLNADVKLRVNLLPNALRIVLREDLRLEAVVT